MPELDEARVLAVQAQLRAVQAQVHRVVVGQEAALEEVLIGLLCGGHCLLEGVPGLAKTLLVRSVAEALAVSFRRIQFTPDLMPSDILGTEILEEDPATRRRIFEFRRGPLFANIVLADEINRTPPKTQSALLEAMQEFAVTSGGKTYTLDRPFFILATQNPIEQAGTYPLPEAQLDRFLLHIQITYPAAAEEVAILKATTGTLHPKIEPVMAAADLLAAQEITRQVFISDELVNYAAQLVRATRPTDSPVEYVRKWVRWGAGPRAGQALILTAKAYALLHGRYAVTQADFKRLLPAVLRHRVLISFAAEAEGITTDGVVQELLRAVPAPTSTLR
jgi:MoxR-like ATPase